MYNNDERLSKMRDRLETAWIIIANVSGGDWAQQSEEWQKAARKWADSEPFSEKVQS